MKDVAKKTYIEQVQRHLTNLNAYKDNGMSLISYAREQSPPYLWKAVDGEIKKWSRILKDALDTDSEFNVNDAPEIKKVQRHQKKTKRIPNEGICCIRQKQIIIIFVFVKNYVQKKKK